MTPGRGRGGRTKRLPPIFRKENYYVGIELNADAANRLMAVQREIAAVCESESIQISWVPAAMLRVTLFHLGLHHQAVMQAVESAGTDVLGSMRPFSVDLSIGGEALRPSAAEPEFLWVDVSAMGDQLTAVSEALLGMLNELGFEPGEGSHPPHITLGVFCANDPVPESVCELLKRYQTDVLCSTTVRELAIFSASWPQTGPKMAVHRWIRMAGHNPSAPGHAWPGGTNHSPEPVIRKTASSQEQ